MLERVNSVVIGRSRVFYAVFYLVVLAVMLVIYLPAYTGTTDFNGDDRAYILDNAYLEEHSLSSFIKQLTSTFNYEYIPITVLSFNIDAAISGLDPKIFRLVNIFIYCAIGILLLSLSLTLNTDLLPRKGNVLGVASLTAIILIMLHPVNVESVAAITSRKELLYALFSILSLKYYIAPHANRKNIFIAIFFAALAQLSKGSAFVIPLMFLAYEILYRRLYMKLRIRILPLAASMLINWSIFSYQLNVAFQKVLSAEGLDLSLAARVGGVIRLLNVMLLKLVFPFRLSYDYEIPWPEGYNVSYEWALPFVVLALVLNLALKKRYIVLFLIIMSFIPLGPYLNVIPIRHGYPDFIVHYDHYMLISVVLSTPLLARGISYVSGRGLILVISAASMVMALFANIDYRQSDIWKNKISLYERSIRTAPDIPRGYYFLGDAYLDDGRYEDAIRVLTVGRRLDGKDENILRTLGDSYAFSGKYGEAEEIYKEYLGLDYDSGVIQNLTNTLILQGKFSEARKYLSIWFSREPDNPALQHIKDFLMESERNAKEKAES